MNGCNSYWRAVVCAAALAVPSVAAADGCKFPEAAYAAMPSIPAQRAMIVFRDGAETLVVESTFETESPSVGWVLPLPAEPTKLALAESGMLRSLSISLKPVIVHDLAPYPRLLLIAFVILVPFAGVIVFSKDATKARVPAVLFLVLALFLWLLLVPGLSTADKGADGAPVPGISLRQVRRIGNYDVAVLRADSHDALSNWLTRNSLKALSIQQEPVVEDYIRRKWCFVVAKLRRGSDRLATPHPISATFPVEAPIYPMKLTALAGSAATRVELFVVADKRAAAQGFDCIASDTFSFSRARQVPDGPQPCYYARNSDLVVGSPDAGEFMWDGCTVTKLSADLATSDMDRDIRIQLTELGPHQRRVFSSGARRALIACVLLTGSIFLLLGLMIACRLRRRPSPREARGLLAIAGAALCAAGIVYLALPVVAVTSSAMLSPLGDILRIRTQLQAVRGLSSQGKLAAQMRASGVANLPQLIKVALGRFTSPGYSTDPIAGKPMRYERSPGNVSTRRADGKLYICFYDLNGREYRVLSPYQGSLPQEKPDER